MLFQRFNIMDQSTYSCKHFLAFLQLDESMSMRQAQEEDMRSVAKSRPMRNFFAYSPHRGSSSSTSNVNSQKILTGRDLERETNNPDSNARKSQRWDTDKKDMILLSTEKSVATKYEEPEDPGSQIEDSSKYQPEV